MVPTASAPPPLLLLSLTPAKFPVLEQWSAQLQARLISIHEKLGGLKEDGSNVYLLHLYQEHLADLKRELRNKILVITTDPLMSNTQKQEDNIFDMSTKVSKGQEALVHKPRLNLLSVSGCNSTHGHPRTACHQATED